MQIYRVGGAVRDELLGLPVQDRDFVVVGATSEMMRERGFVPVGKDFPVFLHPETHEEYALARTERKSAPGYTGFVVHAAPEVTLEDDLRRRDLTINAMARDAQGRLIDPYGGQADLDARVLRHVSPAFAEDPVRILRVARFAARFADFSVADETRALMRAMVDAGEADHLVAERVWQEVSRGLMTDAPMRMFAVLDECGALARCLPEIAARLPGDRAALAEALGCAVARGLPLRSRWALLVDHDARAAQVASERLRVPVPCRDLALLLAREGDAVAAGVGDRERCLAVMERCDVFRRPQRLQDLIDAVACQAGRPPVDRAAWARTVAAARAVDGAAVARATADRAAIPAALRAARLAAMARA